MRRELVRIKAVQGSFAYTPMGQEFPSVLPDTLCFACLRISHPTLEFSIFLFVSIVGLGAP